MRPAATSTHAASCRTSRPSGTSRWRRCSTTSGTARCPTPGSARSSASATTPARGRRGLGLSPDDPLVAGTLKWHVLVGQALLAWEDGELHKMLEECEKGMADRLRALLVGRYDLGYLPRLLDSDIDVDRADFLRRDSQQCGVTYGGYDLNRLISTCALGTAHGGELVVGFERSKAMRVVEQFLVARRAMYEAVYHHKTVCAAEGMAGNFLKRLKQVVKEGAFKEFEKDRIFGALMKMVAEKPVSPQEVLAADDFALHVLIEAVAQEDRAKTDEVVVDLAGRIRSRVLVMRGNVSGPVVTPVRGVELRDGAFVSGKLPLLVVTLKVASNRNVASICFWARKLGLGLKLVHEIAPGALEAYECWGAPDSIERFVSFDFVSDYHLPVACRIGFRASGSGELKPVHRQPLQHVKDALHREDRRAEAACGASADRVRRELLFG
jgi:hypothetical protein